MGDIFVIKHAYHMGDGVHFADIGEKLLPKPSPS